MYIHVFSLNFALNKKIKMKKSILALPIIVGAVALSAFKSSAVTEQTSSLTPPSGKQAVSKWTVDKPHTSVRFAVSHMVVAETEGTFKVFDGTVEHTKADWSDAKINFSVDVNSINTDNDYRDKHLKGDDFFNAEKYPAMTFKSTSFKPLGKNKYELKGDLTIRDITKPVKFDVVFGGITTGAKMDKAGFKATGTINRFDYNLKWNQLTETGSVMVGKEVEIVVRLELNREK
jgi:polyisoprenoid-binding protein YceI